MATAPASDIFLDQSDWREAPLRVDQTIFAIGDVHGCHAQLAVLLDTFKALASNGSARLIFLGDLICRGPNSLAALLLWAAPALEQCFARVHRLSGNHEQLLMLSITGDDESLARAAYDKWMAIGGATFVDELRRVVGRENAPLGRELVREAAGSEVLGQLDNVEHNVCIGNTIFVHGGLDPSVNPSMALAAPFRAFGGNHWAWIQEPFLAWRGGFAAKVQQQREFLEGQLAGLQIYASNKAGAAVRAVMRVPNTRKRAKAKPKYQSKKDKRLKWSGRGMLPIWMREEMKGTKLTKEDFTIK